MLTIDPPPLFVRGTLLFRDHEDPDLFHFLPPPPRIARREGGALEFSLVKYRRDLTDNPALDPDGQKGAGIAIFSTEMASDDPAVRPDRLAAEVGSLVGRQDVRVVPVVFRSGAVRALVPRTDKTPGGDQLFDELVETSPAPIAPPHRAAFALSLKPEGATLFEQAARGGELPVGVAYELKFLALTPSLHARVRMDFDRVHDRFAASFGFHYYVGLELDADLQWLIENDAIRIDITAFTDGEDRERQERMLMDLVRARVQSDFFRTGIPPKPTAAASGALAQLLGGALGSETSASSALFVLKAKYERQEEDKHLDLTFHGRTAVELTHASASNLATLLAPPPDPVGDPPPALDIREIDLDDPFFSTLSVRIEGTIDFSALADLREALVHFEYGDHKASFVFDRDHTEGRRFEAALRAPRDDEYTIRVEYVFDRDAGAGPARIEVGPIRSRRRALVIDPLAHFRYRRVRLRLGPMDPALVPRVHVEVRALVEGMEEPIGAMRLTLDAASPERLFRVRLPRPSPSESEPPRLMARTSWEDARGEVHEGDDVRVEGDDLVVLGPYRDVLSIFVQCGADFARVTQVAVELRYEEPERVIDRRLVFTPTDRAARTVDIPLGDRAKRRYRWRQSIFLLDGTIDERAWAEDDRTLLVVGLPKKTDRAVRVVWVGDPEGVLGLRVDFTVRTARGDEAFGAFLRSGANEQTVTLPLDADGEPTYRFEVRRVTELGEELIRSGEGRSDLLVVRAR